MGGTVQEIIPEYVEIRTVIEGGWYYTSRDLVVSPLWNVASTDENRSISDKILRL